ncbi:hypothetical protein DFA_06697 [Cavenderia fasciculata]|uniref:La-related protein 7 n=1 Tax=Cavenderia fasciculata TaxID=261658 RepID=F4Q210_CACFS|nr:uncharacterized protein DFA_06697 [Cavenderia fasciculata]EGG18030.1 hypothetical protein DFA_06697 [Cavenderia fasciculata]|eukprot:XP_004356923.1 hypothetical protein DFA_06697 [Cavenderia fasciculata]
MEQDKVIEIIKQLQFYLSDSNLYKDRFLSKLVENSNQGWISIDQLLSFNRMKELKVTNESIKQVFQNDLFKQQQGEQETGVTVNQQETMIKRNIPFQVNQQVLNEIDLKTIYIEPILIEDTIENIKEIFKTFGEIVYTSIPRLPDRTPKGFAFIEFTSKESANNALVGIADSHTSQDQTKPFYRFRAISKNEWTRLKSLYLGQGETKTKKVESSSSSTSSTSMSVDIDNQKIDKRILKITNITLTTSKPYLWKSLDKYFESIFLDYIRGDGYAICKFRSFEDREKAKNIIHSQSINIDGQILSTDIISEKEFSRFINKGNKHQDSLKYQKEKYIETKQQNENDNEKDDNTNNNSNNDKLKKKRIRKKKVKSSTDQIVDFENDEQ